MVEIILGVPPQMLSTMDFDPYIVTDELPSVLHTPGNLLSFISELQQPCTPAEMAPKLVSITGAVCIWLT